MKKIDRVKPVKRYRAAKYPSHADPDPTRAPSAPPFPFQREFVRALAGVGLAASLVGCAPQDTPKENPLTLAKSGLPHRTSPFGTGQPAYISDDIARDIIEKVFKENGFLLRKNVIFEKDGLSFRADGYDSERKVGYVFADYKRLDDDAIISWMNPNPKDPATPKEARGFLHEAQYVMRAMPEALRTRAEELAKMPDGPELVAGCVKLRAALQAERLSLEEIRKLEERAPKEKEFIAVVSQFDPRYVISPDARLRQAAEERAKEAVQRLERDVREFLDWARSQGLR